MTLDLGDVVGGRWVGSVVVGAGAASSRVPVGTAGKYPPPMDSARPCDDVGGDGTIGETFWEVDGWKSWVGGPGWGATG
jgi:hypothetical protein